MCVRQIGVQINGTQKILLGTVPIVISLHLDKPERIISLGEGAVELECMLGRHSRLFQGVSWNQSTIGVPKSCYQPVCLCKARICWRVIGIRGDGPVEVADRFLEICA